MTDKTWKQCERKIADLLDGGKRIPVSGRQRGDSPDVLPGEKYSNLSVEIKHKKRLPKWLHRELTAETIWMLLTRQPEWLLDAMDQATHSCREGQVPVVFLHEKNQEYLDCYVVMRECDCGYGVTDRLVGLRLRHFREWYVWCK